MIERNIKEKVTKYLSNDEKKILFIWGPRRSGKTTLLKNIAKEHSYRLFNFDDLSDREAFVPRKDALKEVVKQNKVILIDEVQNYPESTIPLKILFDEFDVKIIATGSSELRQKSANFDSLAGRFIEHYCLPLSIEEIEKYKGIQEYETNKFKEDITKKIQVYGAYPEVFAEENTEKKETLLQGILNTYVLKDVINIYDLKNEQLAKDILSKIALQIGSEVSVRELANTLNASAKTVANYIEIFIKNYILIPLPSFKTNARRAVSENRKLYFYDLGIRNILIKDFRPLELRPDKGGLFENFIISEIEKKKKNESLHKNTYFYREYGGKEVDLVIEDYQKNYVCIEIKVNENRKIKKQVFPIPHTLVGLNENNYFKIVANLNNQEHLNI